MKIGAHHGLGPYAHTHDEGHGCQVCGAVESSDVYWWDLRPCRVARRLRHRLDRQTRADQRLKVRDIAAELVTHAHLCTAHGHVHVCSECSDAGKPNDIPQTGLGVL
jgi:hypothetical protein